MEGTGLSASWLEAWNQLPERLRHPRRNVHNPPRQYELLLDW